MRITVQSPDGRAFVVDAEVEEVLSHDEITGGEVYWELVGESDRGQSVFIEFTDEEWQVLRES